MISVAVWSGKRHAVGGVVSTEQFENMEAARAAHPRVLLRQLRVCTKCKHAECPFCGDWCDNLIGDDFDPCCDSRCTYVEAEPYAEDRP